MCNLIKILPFLADYGFRLHYEGSYLLRSDIINKLKSNPTIRAVLLIFVITFIAAALVAFFEGKANTQFSSFWDAVWWVLVTISTVGYGDKVPITPEGRVVAIFIMLFGIALLSVITATISSILVTRKIREGKGLQETKVKNHIILCGWNVQAEQILSTLEKSKQTGRPLVLINQLSEEEMADIFTRYKNLNLRFVRGDFTHENILNRANAKEANSAIILPDASAGPGKSGDDRTILACLSLKSLNPKVKVYAHVQNRENLTHLRKAKADEVIVSDAYSGFLLANHVSAPGIPQFFEQLFSETSPYRLVREVLPDQFKGRTYREFKEFYQQSAAGILLGLGQLSEPFKLSDLMSDNYSYLDDFIMRKFQEAGRNLGGEGHVKIQINPSPETILSEKDFYLAIESAE